MAPCDRCGCTATTDDATGVYCLGCGEHLDPEPIDDAFGEAYAWHHATEARAAMWGEAA